MLSEYLSLESQRINIKDAKALGEEFQKKIVNFFSDFNALDREHHNRIVNATKDTIAYHFITFPVKTLIIATKSLP